MVPPIARSSLGVGGLGPNSVSPFFFSSSTLAAAGPLAFISFLRAKRNNSKYTLKKNFDSVSAEMAGETLALNFFEFLL